MPVQWWGHHEVMGTLKPYHKLKNLFELIALKGGGDTKTFGTNSLTQVQVVALMSITSASTCSHPHGETFTT